MDSLRFFHRHEIRGFDSVVHGYFTRLSEYYTGFENCSLAYRCIIKKRMSFRGGPQGRRGNPHRHSGNLEGIATQVCGLARNDTEFW